MFGLFDMVAEDDTNSLDDLTQVEDTGVDGGKQFVFHTSHVVVDF